ncbi:TetR/AcrR family transcriptional regulator [Desertihabitans brevis]|uniref:TetR/AcrR family transcriptional regulator n=1 Tax=Desertihabitans brevis TaxID=2268447 RepID=A0A367YV42_9ACTN|nr:TetR/AcrR family transcriptional regulator [Desertihabitans brevis]RCK69734.1 TetR/AcrR family transcriptional regulator [Desertihabitans brevis]
MSRGRTRTFDLDQALDRAVDVFWRRGYDATSIAELTEAMGINPPSLYAAFGNKRALFDRVVDRYVQDTASNLQAAVAQATGRAAVRSMLTSVVESATSEDHPAGCLLVQGALACSAGNADVHDELVRRREEVRQAMQLRFEQALDDGDFPRGIDPARLARYYVTVATGLTVQAASGVPRRELLEAVDLAMAAFPDVSAGAAR